MRVVQLLVQRDKRTQVPVTVPDYERPVFEQQFGASNVRQIGEAKTDAKFDAEVAWRTLLGKPGAREVVLAVYPSPKALFDAVKRANAPKAESSNDGKADGGGSGKPGK